MRNIILVLLFTTAWANAQLISRAELRSTNTALINRIIATNNALKVTIEAKQSGSFQLSNLLAMGITNIVAGTNAVIYTNGGTLVISGTGTGAGTNSFSTNELPVIQVTNLLAENIASDTFTVGVLIPTNTVYIAQTLTAISNGTNFVADFMQSEQALEVAGAVSFVHATNLWGAPTNAYLCITLKNFSGSNQTLAIPAEWKESLNFPTILTNATITQLALKNYGGLSQSNIIAGAAQF